MNRKYWDNFYKEKKGLNKPTDFAKFCIDYLPENLYIVDLGCGNGRDTKLLAKKSHLTIGIDRAIKNKNEYRCIFEKEDVLQSKWLEERYINVYYSRFFLHSISNREIISILKKINNCVFMAECRAKEDIPLIYKGHKRNLINEKWLINKLYKYGFEIKYFIKGKGLAKLKEEDPVIIRVIAQKK